MSGAEECECVVCHKKGTENPLLNCENCRARKYCGTECKKSDWPTHERTCKAPNYILKVTLLPNEITNPSIIRTLSCPASASFFQLHEALQISFGWASTHLFEFKLRPPGSGFAYRFDFSQQPVEDIFQIIDDGAEESPDDSVLMAAFSGLIPAFKHPPRVKASNISIQKVLDDEKYKDAVINYQYDFGDGWEHFIVVVGRESATDKFTCISGEGHGAAEDVGGFDGWERLKTAYTATEPTKEQRKFKKWFENTASNRDPQGLGGGRASVWDQEGVNMALTSLLL